MASEKKNKPKGSARFTLLGADTMRAEVGASTNQLAQKSNLSIPATKKVLAEDYTQRTSCERTVNGLKALGHPTADYDMIVEHLPTTDEDDSDDAEKSAAS